VRKDKERDMRTVRELIGEARGGGFDRKGLLNTLVFEAYGAAWSLEKGLRGDVGLSADDMERDEYRGFKQAVVALAAQAEKMREAYVDLAEVATGHGKP
jgi:hypothetical protein